MYVENGFQEMKTLRHIGHREMKTVCLRDKKQMK